MGKGTVSRVITSHSSKQSRQNPLNSSSSGAILFLHIRHDGWRGDWEETWWDESVACFPQDWLDWFGGKERASSVPHECLHSSKPVEQHRHNPPNSLSFGAINCLHIAHDGWTGDAGWHSEDLMSVHNVRVGILATGLALDRSPTFAFIFYFSRFGAGVGGTGEDPIDYFPIGAEEGDATAAGFRSIFPWLITCSSFSKLLTLSWNCEIAVSSGRRIGNLCH